MFSKGGDTSLFGPTFALPIVMKQACSGVMVFVFLGLATDVDSRPRRETCEQWRDYYYSVETGEFIEWIGEPYWICYPADEPISRPGGASPNDYGGGWGVPRDPKKPTCSQCKQRKDDCDERVKRGFGRCMDHYRDLARTWCVREERNNGNKPIEADYDCTTLEDVRGKPVKDCWGEGMVECVASYENDQPGRTTENTMTIEIGPEWLSVGGSHGSSATWGGSRGFRQGCKQAEAATSGICLANFGACEEAAGGCR